MSKLFRPIHLVAGVACLAVASCGGGDGQASAGSAQREFQEAALEHAECMRRKGIEIPDPKPGQGLVLDGGDVDPERLERAQQECDREVGRLPLPELSAEDQREFRDAALAHARCMRRHGVDMPDPKFGPNGSATIELGAVPPMEDPAFREAARKCRGHLARAVPEPGGER